MRAWATRGVAIVFWLASSCAWAQSATPADSGVDAARETVGKWIATQKLIYQERKDWQQQKEMLGSRIELIRKEIADVEAKLTETRRTASDADAKRSTARAAKQELVDQSAQVTRMLEEFETAVRGIERTLPTPVQEKIRPLFQRLPDDPRTTKVSVAERLQNVLGIMNEVNKANGDISLASEVRTLGDGKPSEVKTVYLGLAQAYYRSPNGDAGIGRPTPDGWVWTPAPELSSRILEVIEILEGKAQPKFVPLPVKIS